MEQHFFEFQKKRRILKGMPKFSEMSHREFPFHLTFLTEFPELSVKRLAFRKFNIFRGFWEFPTVAHNCHGKVVLLTAKSISISPRQIKFATPKSISSRQSHFHSQQNTFNHGKIILANLLT